MEYKEITEESKADIRLPNEAFDLFGRMHVNRNNGKWTHEIELFYEVETMIFPDEKYELKDIHKNGFAIGAYFEGVCVGLAIYTYNWNKYIYLSDLKVSKEFREKGVAAQLIKEGQKIADAKGYKGIYTVGQDNNLAACKFYLKQDFEIGGFNTRDYSHTQQEGKADIYFYLDN